LVSRITPNPLVQSSRLTLDDPIDTYRLFVEVFKTSRKPHPGLFFSFQASLEFLPDSLVTKARRGRPRWAATDLARRKMGSSSPSRAPIFMGGGQSTIPRRHEATNTPAMPSTAAGTTATRASRQNTQNWKRSWRLLTRICRQLEGSQDVTNLGWSVGVLIGRGFAPACSTHVVPRPCRCKHGAPVKAPVQHFAAEAVVDKNSRFHLILLSV
jgi:hypothetical protein